MHPFFLILILCFSNADCTEKAKAQWQTAVKQTPDYPQDRFTGRGIVIAAGGTYYLINAYVNVRMLRESGCNLPVEIWYIGQKEVHLPLMNEIEKSNAVCKDITEYFPYSIKGFEVKVHAIAASSFKEVLLIDADNVVIRNPEFLFDTPEFLQTGALFWPDVQALSEDNILWDLLDLPPQKARAQESGQLLIDKERCWLPLQLCVHMNKNSSFYYKYVHGDKDTFHLSWRALGASYHMCPHVPGILKRSEGDRSWGMGQLQRDLEGAPLFCHTTTHNWAQRYSLKKLFYNYTLPERELSDFDESDDPVYVNFQSRFPRFEERCLTHLKKVREIWRFYD